MDDQLLNEIAKAERIIPLRDDSRRLGIAAIIAVVRIISPGTPLRYEVVGGRARIMTQLLATYGERNEYDLAASEERGILIAKDLANSTYQQQVWIRTALYRR